MSNQESDQEFWQNLRTSNRFFIGSTRLKFKAINYLPAIGVFAFLIGGVVTRNVLKGGEYEQYGQALLVLSIGFAILCQIIVTPITALISMRKLGKDMMRDYEKAYGMSFESALHIGVAPGETLKIYSGDTSWDFGYLLLEEGFIRYYGDRTNFALAADKIQSMEIKHHTIAYFFKMPRICVRWKEADNPQLNSITLEVRDAGSIRELWKKTRALQQEIAGERGKAKITAEQTSTMQSPMIENIKGKAVPGLASLSCMEMIALITGTIIVGIIASTAVILIFGENSVNSKIFRYGTIVAAVIGANIIFAWYKKKQE